MADVYRRKQRLLVAALVAFLLGTTALTIVWSRHVDYHSCLNREQLRYQIETVEAAARLSIDAAIVSRQELAAVQSGDVRAVTLAGIEPFQDALDALTPIQHERC